MNLHLILTPKMLPYLAIPVGISILALSICINFLMYDSNEPRKVFRASPVDTLTMSLFAVGASLLVTFRIAEFPAWGLSTAYVVSGLTLFYAGIAVNLAGRWSLGPNWSDQIRIRQKHTVVQRGIYRYIRHPLYASTIAMLLGAGLVFRNGAVLGTTALIFIPMMIYRARQEEANLIEALPEYADYRRRTGMFLPKPFARS